MSFSNRFPYGGLVWGRRGFSFLCIERITGRTLVLANLKAHSNPRKAEGKTRIIALFVSIG